MVKTPDDTSLASEHIPSKEDERPENRKLFEEGPRDDSHRDPKNPKRSMTANRQDGMLGDVSPRDESHR